MESEEVREPTMRDLFQMLLLLMIPSADFQNAPSTFVIKVGDVF